MNKHYLVHYIKTIDGISSEEVDHVHYPDGVKEDFFERATLQQLRQENPGAVVSVSNIKMEEKKPSE